MDQSVHTTPLIRPQWGRALFLGARRVIAVNATALEPLERPKGAEKVLRRRPVTGALKEAMRAIDVMQTTMVELKAQKQKVPTTDLYTTEFTPVRV